MPRNQSTELRSIMTGDTMNTAWILDFYGSTWTLRVTDNISPLTIEGYAYTPAPFKLPPLREQEDRTAAVTLNVPAFLQVDPGTGAISLAKLLTQVDHTGMEVRVRYVENSRQTEPQCHFEGVLQGETVTGANGGEVGMSLQPVSAMPGRRFPANVATKYCGVTFKGPRCQYAGADGSCTYLRDDCISKGNEANIREIPWL